MAYTRKRIDVSFSMANGKFDGGGNTYTATGLRVSANINNCGGYQQSYMILSVYGLPLSVMNQLSTVGTQLNKIYNNSIVVMAGDDESGMKTVFAGSIYTALVDGNNMPQMCLRVIAHPGAYHSVNPVPPISIRGSADVAGMMSNLAKQMGLSFENAGVNVKLSNPYYGGTAWSQMLQIARDAGIEVIVDKGTMAIVSPSSYREGDTVLISPETGMVGYPSFNQANIIVRSLYNPAVKFHGLIEVRSSITPANGTWRVYRLEYNLESEMPNGAWFMDIEATTTGYTVP